MLFYIEDNGYGISVPAQLQTPGGNIAANLAAFSGLTILDGDGTDPRRGRRAHRARRGRGARAGRAPVLLRLTVPRLSGHSGQDTQAYKSPETWSARNGRAIRCRGCIAYLVPACCMRRERLAAIAARGARGRSRPPSSGRWRVRRRDPEDVTRHVFSGCPDERLQEQGGLRPRGHRARAGQRRTARPEGTRINMLTAIRRTLDAGARASIRACWCSARTSAPRAACTA